MAAKRRRKNGRFVKNGSAPKRPRRRAVTARANPRRRRRRAGAAHAANPVRRRRRARHNAHRVSHRRRGHRRNPPGGALMRDLLQGLEDGASVVGGQVACRKLATGVAAMIPTPTDATTQKVQYVGLRLAAAAAIGFASKRFLPKYSRFVTAGAFAEAINAGLAQTPIAPYLAAIPRRRVLPMVNAWPAKRLPAGHGVGAWPMRSPGLPVQVGN